MKACADKFAAAITSATDNSGFIINACNAAKEWFGGAEVTNKQLSTFADAVCDAAGISGDVDKRKAPRSRFRKLARHRIALPTMVAAIKADQRFTGQFSMHEGLKVATILNKEPNMSATKCVNAYYAKKVAGAKKALATQLQDMATKLAEIKGAKKGTANHTLIQKLLKAFADAEYIVE